MVCQSEACCISRLLSWLVTSQLAKYQLAGNQYMAAQSGGWRLRGEHWYCTVARPQFRAIEIGFVALGLLDAGCHTEPAVHVLTRPGSCAASWQPLELAEVRRTLLQVCLAALQCKQRAKVRAEGKGVQRWVRFGEDLQTIGRCCGTCFQDV